MSGLDDEKLEHGIFLSWSGPASHDVAVELKKWIRFIIQAAHPWMSDEDIAPGSNWFGAISDKITQSKIGIICVTKENQYSPWLLWEAGALYAGFRDSQLVVPLLINMKISELVAPLRHFQVVDARNREEMRRMLTGISELVPDHIRPTAEMIDIQLDHFWDSLQNKISDTLRLHQVSESGENAGVRTFGDAAQQFLAEQKDGHGPSYVRDQHALRWVGPYINHLPIGEVTNSSLTEFKKDRLEGRIPHLIEGKKVKPAMIGTINKELRTVSAILNRAVTDWGWMRYAPTIRQVSGESKKQYPLTWEEQDRILECLPEYSRAPVTFALNTGLRRNEIRQLSWSQLDKLGDSDIHYFKVPIGHKHQKYVVLNSIARQVIEQQDGMNEKYVFTTADGAQLKNFGDKNWLRAWIKAGLPSDEMTLKGVDNLRHTFSIRLRHAGVSQDDIDMLMGSTKAHILKRYSQPDLGNLLKLVEKITVRREEPIVHH